MKLAGDRVSLEKTGIEIRNWVDGGISEKIRKV